MTALTIIAAGIFLAILALFAYAIAEAIYEDYKWRRRARAHDFYLVPRNRVGIDNKRGPRNR